LRPLRGDTGEATAGLLEVVYETSRYRIVDEQKDNRHVGTGGNSLRCLDSR